MNINENPVSPISPEGSGGEGSSGISTPTFLFMDEHQKIYGLRENEIDDLASCGGNLGKDFCLTSGGVSLPTLMNAWAIYEDAVAPVAPSTTNIAFDPGANFVLNLIVGLVALSLSVFYGIQWFRTATKTKEIVDNIKNKPLWND